MSALLVVPAKGDPGGLLREGSCGARPPMVHRQLGQQAPGYEFLSQWSPRGCRSADTETALVLWWDGKLVPEGWHRASLRAGSWDSDGRAAMHLYPTLEEVLEVAQLLVDKGLAERVVLLAAEGREVSP